MGMEYCNLKPFEPKIRDFFYKIVEISTLNALATLTLEDSYCIIYTCVNPYQSINQSINQFISGISP